MSMAAAVQPRAAPCGGAANPQGKVGPNAVTQVAAALRAFGGEDLAARVFMAAGLEQVLAAPPEKMVDQDLAACLHNALRRALPAQDAAQIAAEAGRRTADYLLAHRIPRAAQGVMKLLPARLAAPILLKAMAANAWTYAGTGHVRTASGRTCVLEIIDNPLAQPDCPWHVAVFERLFRALVTKQAQVRHVEHREAGALINRFEIKLSG
jgi:divinyl protochlorophyllide a 8-vinyl-reductase